MLIRFLKHVAPAHLFDSCPATVALNQAIYIVVTLSLTHKSNFSILRRKKSNVLSHTSHSHLCVGEGGEP
jgi:hypothetical protein